MFNQLPPITKNIILLNIIVYVVTNIAYYVFHNPFLYNEMSGYFPLSPLFRSWQVITSMFMHAPFAGGYGVTHILFNMWTFMSFGPILERALGDKRYLALYFLSGIGAFVLFNAWNFIEYQQIVSGLEKFGFDVQGLLDGQNVPMQGNSLEIVRQKALYEDLKQLLSVPMMGASGAIFGVVAAFTTLYPDSKLMIMFIPFPIKAKYIMPVVIIVSIALGVSGNNGGIAHLAHVGGALIGFLLARIWRKHLYRFN